MKEVKFLLTFETEKDGFTEEEMNMIIRKVEHSNVTVITDLETYKHIKLSLKEAKHIINENK